MIAMSVVIWGLGVGPVYTSQNHPTATREAASGRLRRFSAASTGWLGHNLPLRRSRR